MVYQSCVASKQPPDPSAAFPPRGPSQQPVFCYRTPRSFISALVAELRSRPGPCSYRYIARRLGLKSHSSLPLVLSGTNRLTPPMIKRVVSFFRLSEREAEYLQLAVTAQYAPYPAVRTACATEMLRMLDIASCVSLQHQPALFASWTNLPVLAAIACQPFDGDYAALSQRLIPPLSLKETRLSVSRLLRAGALKRHDECLVPNVTALSTTPDALSSRSKTLHARSLDLASNALHHLDSSDTIFALLTCPLDRHTFLRAVEEIEQCSRSIAALSMTCEVPDRAYMFSLSVFPTCERARASQLPTQTDPVDPLSS